MKSVVSRTKLCQSTVVVLGDFDDFGGWMDVGVHSQLLVPKEKREVLFGACFMLQLRSFS